VSGWDAVIEGNRATYGAGVFVANEIEGDTSAGLCLRSMRAMPESGGYCGAGAPAGAVACARQGRCNRVSNNVAVFPSGFPLSLGAAVQSAGPRAQVHLSHAVLTGNRGWSLVGHGDGAIPSSGANLLVGDSLLADNTLEFGVVFGQFVDRVIVKRSTIAGNSTVPFRMHEYNLFQLWDSIVWEPDEITLVKSGSTGADSAFMVLAGEVASLGSPLSAVVTTDPGFWAAADGDYRLRADSPAVDFSNTTAAIRDLDGSPRGVDLPIVINRFGPRDLGAYELQGLDVEEGPIAP
jgi:hypothetical protein